DHFAEKDLTIRRPDAKGETGLLIDHQHCWLSRFKEWNSGHDFSGLRPFSTGLIVRREAPLQVVPKREFALVFPTPAT
ncbi:hypothetical protein ACC792_37275, partial [Rhizobium ruizarguesonis]